MKISFISTLYNEETTIDAFLISLSKQTKLPDEIILCDAGSSDKTVEKLKLFQKKSKIPVKIIIQRGNRSIGRNKAIQYASGSIIACSDAGCILDKNWIKNIIKPFADKKLDVVSGYYLPQTENTFQKSLAAYTCVMPDKINPHDFLPSSRSIAFKKSAWQAVGGYPENLDTCEDLIFATQLKKAGFQFKFVQNAIVHWPQRKNILQAFKQFFSYAVGDGQARFIRPQVPLLFIRYLVGLVVLFCAIYFHINAIMFFLLIGIVLYIIWAIQKNYKYVKELKALLYLPLLQFTADIAVISGTSIGLLTSKTRSVRNYAILGLLGVMMVMLFTRSIIFTTRLIKELKAYPEHDSKNAQFLPSIQPCKHFKLPLNAEEQHILNYRSLGTKCRN